MAHFYCTQHIVQNQIIERKGWPSYFDKDSIFFRSTDYNGGCKKFIENNFEEISEI